MAIGTATSQLNTHHPPQPRSIRPPRIQNDFRLEASRSYVCLLPPAMTPGVAGSGRALPAKRRKREAFANRESRSYNKYLTVAARAVRKGLKEEHRLASERRGQTDLKFSNWEVGPPPPTPVDCAELFCGLRMDG